MLRKTGSTTADTASDMMYSNGSITTMKGPVGVVEGAGSGTLVGRFQIGHTTATNNNSLVFWRGIKPTLGGNHGAILYENGGLWRI